MVSKIHPDIKKYRMISKSTSWPQKILKVLHDIQKYATMPKSIEIGPDIKNHGKVDLVKSMESTSWHQKERHKIKKFGMYIMTSKSASWCHEYVLLSKCMECQVTTYKMYKKSMSLRQQLWKVCHDVRHDIKKYGTSGLQMVCHHIKNYVASKSMSWHVPWSQKYIMTLKVLKVHQNVIKWKVWQTCGQTVHHDVKK